MHNALSQLPIKLLVSSQTEDSIRVEKAMDRVNKKATARTQLLKPYIVGAFIWVSDGAEYGPHWTVIKIEDCIVLHVNHTEPFLTRQILVF